MVKFLIVRFSSIGDIVLTTPVIRCIKQQVEGAEVHFVTKKQFASVVSNNPYIDKVHVLDSSLDLLIKTLKQEEFDYIIDLHSNLRSLILKTKLKVLAFSFNKINFAKWLIVNLKIDRLPQKHIVDRYLETCSLFDIENDGKGLDFFIDPKNEVQINFLPEAFQNGYISLVIGAKHATKQLPADKLGMLCKSLNLPVVLQGGPDDKLMAESIIQYSNSTPIYNACGGFNLQQSASILKQAKVVVTHDTGLMHIAAAFKKNIVSIWGNTIPEFGMYPYVDENLNKSFEVKNLKCRPCSKIGFTACPKKHFNCMNQQNIQEITQYIKFIIA